MKPAFGGLSHLSCATSSPTPVGLSSPKPVYLRPSQLTVGSSESPQQGTSQSPSPLKPPSLGNPFARGKFDQECENSTEYIFTAILIPCHVISIKVIQIFLPLSSAYSENYRMTLYA
jgi:hypothetical protein